VAFDVICCIVYVVRSRSKQPMGCELVKLNWLENVPLCRRTLTSKVGQSNLVLVNDQSSLAGLCVQDYRSLCAAVTICAILFNGQTHRKKLCLLASCQIS